MSTAPRFSVPGVVLALAAVACFAAYDAGAKLASAGVPLVLALWVRYGLQAILAARTIASPQGLQAWHTQRRGMHIVRALALLGCNVFSFLSFTHLTVAEVTAILMLTPVLMTLFSAYSLGETVSPGKWLLVGMGFVGALLVVKPTEAGLDLKLLLPLGLLAFNTVFQALTSQLVRTESPRTVFVYTTVVGLLSLSLILPMFWTGWPSGHYGAILLLMALLSTCGHHMLVLAYARTAASRVTPLLYFQLLFSAVAGWCIFDQVPDSLGFLGMALIALSGILNRPGHREGANS